MKLLFRLLILSLSLHCISFAQTLDEKINNIIAQMTLQEKILQLHQEGSFNTADNTRLKIPGLIMSDGPHGVRDGLATCFPVGISMAATWDTALIKKVGYAMGQEFKGKGKHQALGPCMDLTKDPRNGRSAESGGEDPFLDAQITTSLVKGIQSAGIIATSKHFNLDSKQNGRFTNDYSVSRRNLMEHLGLNYRTAIQQGGLLSVMNAYNLVNGLKCAENPLLLTTILRDNWGFPFYVVSDWGSIWTTKNAILAGCNIEMGSSLYESDLYNLVTTGEVPESVINNAVYKVLRTKFAAGLLNYFPPGNSNDVNSTQHQQIALDAARKSMILLKNSKNILPLSKTDTTKIALIGPSADVAQLDGEGSAYVTPFYSISPRQGIENKIGASRVFYTKGCDINSTSTDGFGDALLLASKCDYVIYVGGLDQTQEGEGMDRVTGSVTLPGNQQDLINMLAAANSKTIVVLNSGGVCAIQKCIDNIKGLIYAFYPGEEGGTALADVLFGDYNPAGRLPVTMPLNDSQMPDNNFSFDDDYGCGYRWYDQMKYTPQYAFGHGLSYTTFSYSNISVTPNNAPLGSRITVTCDVTNTGSRAGEEVVQLYISHTGSTVPMPVKQLKGFQRIPLLQGETKTVKFDLTSEELYYYNEGASSYLVDPGTYSVNVGCASDSLPLSGSFYLQSTDLKPDLRVTWIKTVPAYPVKGDTVLFLAGVTNQGTGKSPANTIHKVSFKINGVLVATSTELDSSLSTGSMRMVCSNTGVPWVASAPGQYSIEAIEECLEDNNAISSTFSVYPAPSVNLALGKDVTVSSVETAAYPGSNAVDGNRGTRWSSAFADPQYLIVDLGEVTHFNTINIYWETAYAKDYTIQISDNGLSWTTLATITNGIGGMDAIQKVADARFIKMNGTSRGTQYGYSIFEFEVYNVADTIQYIAPSTLKPSAYRLDQNYPNPFNPSTRIAFNLPYESKVKIKVYAITGELVKELVNGVFGAGYREVQFNAGQLSSGIYFYVLETSSLDGKQSFRNVKKMILMK
jgi:beta-glucosidase